MFARDTGYNPAADLPIDTISIVRKHMDVDTAAVSTPFSPAAWDATAPATGLLAYRDEAVEFSGLIQARQLNWDAESGRALIHLECVGDAAGLAQRLVFPDPLRAADDQTVNDYWTYTGTASTAMHQLISDQAGPTCRADRQIPGITMGADPGLGVSRPWQGLFNGAGPNGVLDQLAVMSAASGADLGVRMTGAAGALTADIVAPRDLADSMRFSADLGNLVGLFYRETAPTVTHALAAGQGDLHARLRKLAVTTDPLALQWAIQAWSYVDRSDTADATVLLQACTDAIAQGVPTVSLTATLTDSQAATYRTDWDLGDRITVYVGLPGQATVATVSDVVRQISLTVDNAGKEVLQPAIGSYDAKAIIPTPTQQKLADAANALAGLISRK